MDATVIVATVGLATTALSPLLTAYLQARLTSKNAADDRLHAHQMATYSDAMTFVHAVQQLVDLITIEDVYARPRLNRSEIPEVDVITARLMLVAPQWVDEQWRSLALAYESFHFRVDESGPINDRGDYYLGIDDPFVQGLRTELAKTTEVLRLQTHSDSSRLPRRLRPATG